jgi:hypothetical protein
VAVTDRAVSTVLDASLAVVLVVAALLVVASAPAAPTDDVGTDRADAVSETLGATTARVEYSLAPGVVEADETLLSFPEEPRSGPSFRRNAHGTLAGLLARAATTAVAVDGEEVGHATDGFQREVASATRDALRAGGDRTQFRAVWRPFPGSTVQGRVVVGESPPADADVHAATTNLTSGFPTVEVATRRPRDYRTVARAVANATVRGLFPPDRTELALDRDYPVSRLVAYRYLHAGDLLEVEVEPTLRGNGVRAANRRIARALTDRFTLTLRDRYPSPAAAAANVSVGTVTVTVRTWSP